MTDTHTHIYYPESFPEGPAEAHDRAVEAGVGMMVLPAVDKESVAPILQLHSQRPDTTRTAMGLHPTEVGPDWRDELDFIVSMLKPTRPVAIGEVGIDLYWDKSNLELQKEAFIHQLRLAREQHLPVIIHCREALDVCLDCISTEGRILPSVKLKQVSENACSSEGRIFNENAPRLIFHSFTGSPDDVRKIRKVCDPYFGINGVVTFKNAKELPAAIKEIGIDRILLETDSPYLAPVPKRGRRNESAYLPHIAARVAEILGMTPEEVEKVTDRNAKEVFQHGGPHFQ